MPTVAMDVGANRVVAGAAITTPLGTPSDAPGSERRFRRELVLQALELLSRHLEEQTLVAAGGPGQTG